MGEAVIEFIHAGRILRSPLFFVATKILSIDLKGRNLKGVSSYIVKRGKGMRHMDARLG